MLILLLSAAAAAAAPAPDRVIGTLTIVPVAAGSLALAVRPTV